MAEPVPDKGRVLTAMSAFWFELLADVAPNHLSRPTSDALPAGGARPALAGADDAGAPVRDAPDRVHRARATCRARRGRSTATRGTVHGVRAAGRAAGGRSGCPSPIFTPSTKAASRHPRREHLLRRHAVALVGGEVAEAARALSLAVYAAAAAHAEARGIIVADTKFELGFLDGALVLADEVLTPDSSRFWPADRWSPGSTPPSFDKQPVRDWLEASGWDKRPPPPPLPAEVDRRHPSPLRRGLRAHLGPVVRRLARLARGVTQRAVEVRIPAGVPTRATMAVVTFSVLVEVRLRAGIADPQGATIERSLPTLGFDEVSGVTVGKAIRFSVEAAGRGRGATPGRRAVRALPHQPGHRGCR